MKEKTIIYHDITLPLACGMTVYPGDPPFVREQLSSLLAGDDCNLSALSLGSHTGTHLDAPSHYLPGGLTLDEISLKDLIGPAKVIEIPATSAILTEHLEGRAISQGDRVLFKTFNSSFLEQDGFRPDYIYLSPEAAEFLVEKKVRLVGIDYYSVDSYGCEDGPSHKLLLAANVLILEGLNLKNIREGEYILLALPLKIRECDGSPLRAVLMELK